VPRPPYGPSQDGRDDRTQVLLSLGVRGDGGIPLRGGLRDGNRSASVETPVAIEECLALGMEGVRGIVAESQVYSRRPLGVCLEPKIDLVTLVPRTGAVRPALALRRPSAPPPQARRPARAPSPPAPAGPARSPGLAASARRSPPGPAPPNARGGGRDRQRGSDAVRGPQAPAGAVGGPSLAARALRVPTTGTGARSQAGRPAPAPGGPRPSAVWCAHWGSGGPCRSVGSQCVGGVWPRGSQTPGQTCPAARGPGGRGRGDAWRPSRGLRGRCAEGDDTGSPYACQHTTAKCFQVNHAA